MGKGKIWPSANPKPLNRSSTNLNGVIKSWTFTFTCREGDHKSGHPALRPLHGPSAATFQAMKIWKKIQGRSRTFKDQLEPCSYTTYSKAEALTGPSHWLQFYEHWRVCRDKTGWCPKDLCNRRQWPTDSWREPWMFPRLAGPTQSTSLCTSTPALQPNTQK